MQSKTFIKLLAIYESISSYILNSEKLLGVGAKSCDQSKLAPT